MPAHFESIPFLDIYSAKLLCFIIVFFLFLLPGTSAQSIDTLFISGGSTELRIPTDERLIELSQNSRYSYKEEQKGLSIWDRFILWLKEKLGDWLKKEYVEWFFKISAALTFISVLYLLINQISKGELKNALARRANRTALNLNTSVADISGHNFEERLQQAILKKDFSLAVRYVYQFSVQLLKEAELIQWKPNKTNHDFLHEIRHHPVAEAFDRLTYFYEYVDYGDFKIDEPRFTIIQNVFQQFKNTLKKPV